MLGTNSVGSLLQKRREHTIHDYNNEQGTLRRTGDTAPAAIAAGDTKKFLGSCSSSEDGERVVEPNETGL